MRIKPNTKEERQSYRDAAIASYEKELDAAYPNHFVDLYYSTHTGLWTIKTTKEEWEVESKSRALYQLAVSSLK